VQVWNKELFFSSSLLCMEDVPLKTYEVGATERMQHFLR
jgi:hypothetical protein